MWETHSDQTDLKFIPNILLGLRRLGMEIFAILHLYKEVSYVFFT